MKNANHLLTTLFIPMAMVFCSLCGQITPKGEEPVVETQNNGSLVVNPTAAAQSEFAVETKMAAIEAMQQSMLQEIQATIGALKTTE